MSQIRAPACVDPSAAGYHDSVERSHLWMVKSDMIGFRGTQSPPWACQVLHTELDETSFVVDLVALESCPAASIKCPALMPFALEIALPGKAAGASCEREIKRWSKMADVISLIVGEHEQSSWLCLSAGDRHLVVETTSAPGRSAKPW